MRWELRVGLAVTKEGKENGEIIILGVHDNRQNRNRSGKIIHFYVFILKIEVSSVLRTSIALKKKPQKYIFILRLFLTI